MSPVLLKCEVQRSVARRAHGVHLCRVDVSGGFGFELGLEFESEFGARRGDRRSHLSSCADEQIGNVDATVDSGRVQGHALIICHSSIYLSPVRQ